MTDITAKPFDWNDNLSKEAIEDFEGIRKDLPYCTCQNIGMALVKLELLEKQGCKVDAILCNCTDEEIAKSFIEDVEAVKDLLPRTESEE